MVEIAVVPTVGQVQGCIRPPGSKSISNRALVCAALASGKTELTGLLVSEDTEVMVDCWHRLGVHVEPAKLSGGEGRDEVDWTHVSVAGCAGKLPEKKADLFVANSGTTIRFLTAALSACEGDFILDGVARMRQRPIGDLLQALQSAGVQATSVNESHPDCPPVRLVATGLPGGRIEVDGDVSSQFLSGLLLAAPYARSELELVVRGELVSRPYVDMTATVMRDFGADVRSLSQDRWLVRPSGYQGRLYDIEPDASAASYFWATAAITGGEVTVQGLSAKSLQGDVHFCDALQQMGCAVTWGENSITVRGGELRGIDIEMSSISDTVQTLAVVALFAKGKTRVRGVAHNRFKETDRIGDLATELRKLGAEVQEHDDGLTIHPADYRPARLATYSDHRMAMSFALAGLRIEGVEIENPGCTNKTYPHFFEDLSRLIGKSVVRQLLG